MIHVYSPLTFLEDCACGYCLVNIVFILTNVAAPSAFFLCRDQAMANGVSDQFAHGVKIELAHQAGAIGFNGSDAEIEADSDLFVAVPLRQQAQDLQFASTEKFRRRCFRGANSLAAEFCSEESRETDATTREGPSGFTQITG